MQARSRVYLFAVATVSAVCGATPAAEVSQCSNVKSLNVGPVALNGTEYASAETVVAEALGSGVNGPQTAQNGLTVNISKDNWWTSGKTGEIDGINVGAVYTADFGALSTGLLIQNSPGASWRYALQYQKDGDLRFSVDGTGNVHTAGSFFVNLSRPAHSSSPCSPGQLGADPDFIYVCVAPNRWRRSPLSSF